MAENATHGPERLTVYGTRWCPQSAATRRWLDRHTVEYDYVDINADDAGAAVVMDLANGHRSVPTLIFPDGLSLVEPPLGLLHDVLEIPLPEPRRWWWPFS